MNKKFWNKKTKDLVPYIPGEQPKEKLIKLNTNENPYPPSNDIKETLNGLDIDILRKYPDPDSSLLKDEICKYYGVEKANVFLGNGSDEVLAFSFKAFFDDERPVAFPEITYSFYPVYANLYDIPIKKIPLREDFKIEVSDYFDLKHAVVLANPNAPTGRALEIEEIKKLLDSNLQRLVIIDEAYVDFGAQSCVNLSLDYDNLLVIQTFSKSRSLAGLRVGFAIGNPSLISALECIRDCINSYTMDTIAQKVAKISLSDGFWFEEIRSKIISTREWFGNELKNLGFKVIPSKANFVFVSHPKINASQLFFELRKKGILVRYFENELTKEYLRITIGTDLEMEEVIKALKIIF